MELGETSRAYLAALDRLATIVRIEEAQDTRAESRLVELEIEVEGAS